MNAGQGGNEAAISLTHHLPGETPRSQEDLPGETPRSQEDLPSETPRSQEDLPSETPRSQEDLPGEPPRSQEDLPGEPPRSQEDLPGEPPRSQEDLPGEPPRSQEDLPGEPPRSQEDLPGETPRSQEDLPGEPPRSQEDLPGEPPRSQEDLPSETPRSQEDLPSETPRSQEDLPSETPRSQEDLPSETPRSQEDLPSEPPRSQEDLPSEPPRSQEDLPSEPPRSQEDLPSEPPRSQEDLPSEPPRSQEDLPSEPPRSQEDLPSEPPSSQKDLPSETPRSQEDLPSETPRSQEDLPSETPRSQEDLPSETPSSQEDLPSEPPRSQGQARVYGNIGNLLKKDYERTSSAKGIQDMDFGTLTDKTNGRSICHAVIACGKHTSCEVCSVLEQIGKATSLEEMVCCQDKSGNTPLHCAITRTDLEIVRFLLKNATSTACLQILNNSRMTPLKLAFQIQLTEITALLMSQHIETGLSSPEDLLQTYFLKAMKQQRVNFLPMLLNLRKIHHPDFNLNFSLGDSSITPWWYLLNFDDMTAAGKALRALQNYSVSISSLIVDTETKETLDRAAADSHYRCLHALIIHTDSDSSEQESVDSLTVNVSYSQSGHSLTDLSLSTPSDTDSHYSMDSSLYLESRSSTYTKCDKERPRRVIRQQRALRAKPIASSSNPCKRTGYSASDESESDERKRRSKPSRKRHTTDTFRNAASSTEQEGFSSLEVIYESSLILCNTSGKSNGTRIQHPSHSTGSGKSKGSSTKHPSYSANSDSDILSSDEQNPTEHGSSSSSDYKSPSLLSTSSSSSSNDSSVEESSCETDNDDPRPICVTTGTLTILTSKEHLSNYQPLLPPPSDSHHGRSSSDYRNPLSKTTANGNDVKIPPPLYPWHNFSHYLQHVDCTCLPHGRNGLHVAVKNGCPVATEFLLRKNPLLIEQNDYNGNSPLYEALLLKHPHLLKQLLLELNHGNQLKRALPVKWIPVVRYQLPQCHIHPDQISLLMITKCGGSTSQPVILVNPASEVDPWCTSAPYDSWQSIIKLVEQYNLSPEEHLLLFCLSIFSCSPVPMHVVLQLSAVIAKASNQPHLSGSLHSALFNLHLLRCYPAPVILHPSLTVEDSEHEFLYVPELISRALWKDGMSNVDKAVTISTVYKALRALQPSSGSDAVVLKSLHGLCALLLEVCEQNYELVGKQCYQEVYRLLLDQIFSANELDTARKYNFPSGHLEGSFSLTVFVSVPSRKKKISLKVLSTDTVAHVKAKLEGITADTHRLLYGGAVLQDQNTLYHYSISEGDVLHLFNVSTGITLQAHVRAHLARKSYTKAKRAIVTLQAHVRAHLARKSYTKAKRAIVTLQAHVRAYLVRKWSTKAKRAIVTLQAHVRAYLARKWSTKAKRAIVTLQAHVRAYLARKWSTKAKQAIVTLQAHVRAYLARKSYTKAKRAIVTLQAHVRAYLARKSYTKAKRAIVTLQAHVRAYLARKWSTKAKQAIVTLQAHVRAHLVRKWSTKAKRAIVTLQAHVRAYLARKSYTKAKRAIVTLQAHVRAYLARKWSTKAKRAIVTLQAHVRAYLVRKWSTKAKRAIVTHLSLIPDSYTTLLPFTETGSILGDHSSFPIMPSLLTRDTLDQLPPIEVCIPADSQNMCVVGNPLIPTGDLRKLPHAAREAEWVAHMLRTSPILEEQATKNAVLIRIRNSKVIHIATHDSPTTKFLAHSSYIYPQDVKDMNILPSLVVLTNCDDRKNATDSIIGMAQAFILAGAQAVLTTLWRVPDEFAIMFMQFFYQYLMDGFSSSIALDKAILSLRCFKKYPQYIHWIGYQLIGREIKFDISKVDTENLLNTRLGSSSVFPRLDIVKKLESAFIKDPQTPTDVQILRGSPGMKPSEPLIDFIHSFHTHFKGGIFWINGGLIAAGMAYIEKVTGTSFPNVQVDDIQPILVVFDHIEHLPQFPNQEATMKLLKNPNVHIIVVSDTPPDSLHDEIKQQLLRDSTVVDIKPLTMIHTTQRLVHSVLSNFDLAPNNEDQNACETMAAHTYQSPIIIDVFSAALKSYLNASSYTSGALQRFVESLSLHKFIPVTVVDEADSWKPMIVNLIKRCNLTSEGEQMLRYLATYTCGYPVSLSTLIERAPQRCWRNLLDMHLLKCYPAPVILHPSLTVEDSEEHEFLYVPELISRAIGELFAV